MFSASQFFILRERHGKPASRWICGHFITKAPTTSEAGGIEGSQKYLIRVCAQWLRNCLRRWKLLFLSVMLCLLFNMIVHYQLPSSRLLQNPFGQRRVASQGSEPNRPSGSNAATRGEKFQRSGRSLSAPGSYDLLKDRLLALVSSWFMNLS
jgi:hypothetical protein